MTRIWPRWLSLLAVLVAAAVISLCASWPARPAAAWNVTPEPFPFSDRYPAEIHLDSAEDVSVLVRYRIDVGDIRPADGERGGPFEPMIATVYVNDKEVDFLAGRGLVAVPIPNESLRAGQLYGPGNGAPDAWPTFEQFVARMQSLADAHPDIVRIASIGQSVQGRALWVLKITDNPDVEEDEPEFKYSANHHGDETVGIEITMRLAELLANSYGVDPTLTELVDEMEIWLWPIFNPDGYVASTRYNAHGEDLNRNFPDRIADPVDDPAGHEPETQAAMYWGYAHRFVMGANYHGGASVVNVPWDSVGEGFSTYAPDDEAFLTYGVGYSSRNTRIWNGGFPQGITRGWEWYIVYGGMQDWAYHWQGEHHATIELGDTKKPPFEQMNTYWDENREAMLWWMERALQGARGLVTDANTGAPLAATVDVLEIGKAVRTDPDVGDYHRLLLPGDYTLIAAAPCYLAESAPVTVVDGPATVHDFALWPAPVWTVDGTVTELGTGRPLSATVELEGVGIVAHTDPATGYYAAIVCQGTYTMTVSAAGHRPASRVVDVTGDQTQDFQLEPAPCTLLVDDDVGENYQTWYQAALDSAGQDYDLWTVAAGGAPTAADLAGYGRVVWLTGDDSSSTLTGSDQTALSSFLDGGGGLFLSGQDIGYDIGTTPFYANYLHAAYLADDTNSYNLTGVNFLAGVDVTIQGGDGANNQSYPSNINTAGGSVPVFDWPSYTYGGVAYQNDTYRVAYLAFGFEAINNAADRTDVMSRTLAWLGECEQDEYAVVAGDSLAAGGPGETVTHTFTITNLSTVADTYTVSLLPGAWEATLLDTNIGPLDPMEAGQVRVTVDIPPPLPGEDIVDTDVLTVHVESTAEPGVADDGRGTTLEDAELGVAVTDSHIAGQPGETVTHTFTVTNLGELDDRYSVTLELGDWPATLLDSSTGWLHPRMSGQVRVAVHIPEQPAGAVVIATDVLTVHVTSMLAPEVTAQAEGTTLAGAEMAVELGTAGAEGAARAGQSITYTLAVTNAGTYTDTFTLSWAAPPGMQWPVYISPAQTPLLGPGGAALILVRVDVPAGPGGETASLTVRATSGWDGTAYAEQALLARRLWGQYLPLVFK